MPWARDTGGLVIGATQLGHSLAQIIPIRLSSSSNTALLDFPVQNERQISLGVVANEGVVIEVP